MIWILTAISGYFFLSVTGLIDKLVLAEINKPRVYAATVGVLGILGFVFFFFGFELPKIRLILISFLAGMLYIFALIPYYKGIQIGQTSRIVSFVGGIYPIIVLILSTVSGIEILTEKQYIAFVIILTGSYLITGSEEKKKNPKISFVWAGLAALFFGIFFFLSKYIYDQSDFISGFVLMRAGGVLAAIILFFYPGTLKQVMKNIKTRKSKKTRHKASLILASQASAAVGFVLINYAVSLGKVSLVNAMAGAQFVFLLILSVIFAKKFPKLMEQIDKKTILKKSLAVLLIGLGLYLLF